MLLIIGLILVAIGILGLLAILHIGLVPAILVIVGGILLAVFSRR